MALAEEVHRTEAAKKGATLDLSESHQVKARAFDINSHCPLFSWREGCDTSRKRQGGEGAVSYPLDRKETGYFVCRRRRVSGTAVVSQAGKRKWAPRGFCYSAREWCRGLSAVDAWFV